MKRLKARLYELELKKREEKAAAEAASKSDIGWGHQIRSYVLQPYQMVKDLRTGVQTSDTSGVLDGDINAFIEAALAHRIKGGGPPRSPIWISRQPIVARSSPRAAGVVAVRRQRDLGALHAGRRVFDTAGLALEEGALLDAELLVEDVAFDLAGGLQQHAIAADRSHTVPRTVTSSATTLPVTRAFSPTRIAAACRSPCTSPSTCTSPCETRLPMIVKSALICDTPPLGLVVGR